jgi:hypothetical protein
MTSDELAAKYAVALKGCPFFEPPKGWLPLVERTLSKLVYVQPNVEILDVKSKFGGLRISAGPLTQSSAAIIRHAEAASLKICEECGEPGVSRRKHGWTYTSCDAHVRPDV